MAQQDRAVVTLDNIVVGAAKTFYKVGYEGASISTIAEAAGVTKGALYFHFRSKEDIARAVIDKEHAIASKAARAIIETTESPVKTMLLMCASLAHQLVTEPIVRAGIRLTAAGPIFDPPTRAPYDDWLQLFESLASRGIDAGELSASTDPAKLAHFIIPSFTGVQLVSDVLTRQEDLAQRVSEMWEFIFPAVAEPAQLPKLLGMLPAIFGTRS